MSATDNGQQTTDTHTLIHNFLETSAKRFPQKTALIHENIRATYAKINGKANRLARWLIDQGITKGDRIVLLLENCLEYVISYYGALKTGAVVAPLSSDIKPDGLRHALGELEPKLLISSSRFERVIRATDMVPFEMKGLILRGPNLKWPSAPFPVLAWEELVYDDEALNPDIPIEESALASIIYTSGSMGMPKGVMLSHKNIVSNTLAICQYLHLREDDIQMVVLPFFYVMGKSLLNTHVAAGGTVVINNKFAFPASVIKQMVEEKVTGFSGVPSTYAYLLHRSPLASYRDKLGSLRYCSQAGGHMSRQIKENLLRVLPAHTKLYIMYGATEASARITYLDPDRLKEKIDSIGRPIPGVILRVLDSKGQEVPAGQIGELVANGPNIMQGYWKDQRATSEVLDGYGYHTGDLGYQDQEGYLFVVGRKDNMVKVGGHRINPREVEDALMDTAQVLETVVLGIPDKLQGHILMAVAAPRNGECSENNIMALCAEKLPRYKLPKRIKLVNTLPKGVNGKIDRVRCLALATA